MGEQRGGSKDKKGGEKRRPTQFAQKVGAQSLQGKEGKFCKGTKEQLQHGKIHLTILPDEPKVRLSWLKKGAQRNHRMLSKRESQNGSRRSGATLGKIGAKPT